jgi:hypothetical protein
LWPVYWISLVLIGTYSTGDWPTWRAGHFALGERAAYIHWIDNWLRSIGSLHVAGIRNLPTLGIEL